MWWGGEDGPFSILTSLEEAGLEVRGDQLRIGVKAPRDVDVHRDEVWAELQEANRAAALPDRSVVEGLERRRRQQPGA